VRTTRPAAALLALSLLPAVAAGFVLPGPYVIKQAAKAAKARRGVQARYAITTAHGAAEVAVRIDSGGIAHLDTRAPPPEPRLVAALLAGDVAAVVAHIGADAFATTLQRFDHRIAIAIGDDVGRPGLPAVWVDRERFVPLRVVAGEVEVRLLGIQGLASSHGLPERIEVRLRGALAWAARLVAPPKR
jgi:hypothetical protein